MAQLASVDVPTEALRYGVSRRAAQVQRSSLAIASRKAASGARGGASYSHAQDLARAALQAGSISTADKSVT